MLEKSTRIFGRVPRRSAVLVLLVVGSWAGSVAAQIEVHGNLSFSSEDAGMFSLAADQSYGRTLSTGDYDGDGIRDLAVGVPGEEVGGYSNAGAIAVHYALGRGGFGYSTRITRDLAGVDGQAFFDDRFGRSLASGDFNGDGRDDLAVGVPFVDLGGEASAGGVHVFYGTSKGLTGANEEFFDRSIVAGGLQPHGRFGEVLATGDFNGDHYDDLAIGTPRDTVSWLFAAGSVVVIHGGPEGLSEPTADLWTQWRLGFENGVDDSEASDFFGASMVAADFDLDGFDELVVGAPGENHHDEFDGGAYSLIWGSEAGLVSADNLFVPNQEGTAGSELGSALAASDTNGDGVPDLVVGEPGHDCAGDIEDCGRVALWLGRVGGGLDLNRTTYYYQHYVDGVVPGELERFGSALVSGDFNADGFGDVVASVPFKNVPGAGPSSGAVIALWGSDARLTGNGSQILHQNVAGVHGTSESGDVFGQAIASGRFDGVSDDLVVGAPGEGLGAFEGTGYVHVLFGSNRIFEDGFESGSTGSWSSVIP